MRVFVTGATGFIGLPVVKELIAAGHQVLGLCRSDDKARVLAATGAEVYRGSINDLEGLKMGASGADAAIHLAFNHDFSRFAQNCEEDRQVVETLGAAFAGSSRPLIITSGTAMADSPPGRPSQEDDPVRGSDVNPRAASEQAVTRLAANGVNVSVVRLPQVHDTAKQGLVTYAIEVFRQKGVCAYVGDGHNRWPAAPVLDVARLYRLAIEQTEPGAIYHAVAEEGVSMRDIVDTLGPRLNLPVKSIGLEEAPEFFGWLAMFAAQDLPASGAKTRKKLGWEPVGRGLIADLENLQRPEG